MEILNPVDLNFLLSLGVMIVIFGIYYDFTKKQNRAMTKVDESLKRQVEANHQLSLIVNELRRSNRLLAELADMEYVDEPISSASQAMSSSSAAGAMQSSSTASQISEPQHKLYVGNIDYAATEAELAAHFSPYGQVEFVNIPVNRYTGKARGFGFVTFVSKEDAESAMALHGTEFKGRQIQVNFAKERESA